MATHSSNLAWKTPWMEEPGRYSLWGCKESDRTEWLHFHFQGRNTSRQAPKHTTTSCLGLTGGDSDCRETGTKEKVSMHPASGLLEGVYLCPEDTEKQACSELPTVDRSVPSIVHQLLCAPKSQPPLKPSTDSGGSLLARRMPCFTSSW